jgi:hypothetical protein
MNLKSVLAILFLVTVFLVVSKQANAYNGWLDVHLTTSHTKRSYTDQSGKDIEYNQNNFGLGLALPVYTNIDVRAGFFKNSFNNTSVYAGADFYVNRSRYFTYGVNAGVASGYENTPAQTSTLAPMLMPHVTFKVNNFRSEIGYIPAFNQSQVAFLTFSVGTRF